MAWGAMRLVFQKKSFVTWKNNKHCFIKHTNLFSFIHMYKKYGHNWFFIDFYVIIQHIYKRCIYETKTVLESYHFENILHENILVIYGGIYLP